MVRSRRALAGLLLGALFIAFAPIFVRMSEAGPIATAFFRMALAWPLLFLWAYATPKPVQAQHTSSSERLWLLIAGACFACDLSAWHWSIKLTTVANATLLANLAPVFVTLGAWLWMGERVSRAYLVGLLLALTGLLLLSGASFSLGTSYLLGDALGVLTAVFYGAYILSISRLRRRLSTARIMSYTTLIASVILLVFTLASGEPLLGLSARAWLVLIALAWLSHAAGQGLITYALAHLPASYSALVLILQPVTAALLAWWLFAESLGGMRIVGALIVLAGIAIASRRSRGTATNHAV